VPDQELLEERAEVDLSEKVFTNSPNMLVLCLTVIGLIKIYTRFEKITTLADNFLAFVCVGYFISTVFAYLALRTPAKTKTAEARQNRRFSFSGVVMLHRRCSPVYDVCAGRLGWRADASWARSEERVKNGQQQAPRLRRACPTPRKLIGQGQGNHDGEPEESGKDYQPR